MTASEPPPVWWSPSLAAQGRIGLVIQSDITPEPQPALKDGELPADAFRLVPDSPDGVLDRWRELGGALTGLLITLEQEGVQLPPRAERGRAVVSDLLANAWEDAAGAVPDTGQARPAYEPDGSVYDEPPASTDALAVAISDPGSILPRDYSNGIETVPSWAARAVRALLGTDTTPKAGDE